MAEKDLFASRVLTDMQDGVIVIGKDGQVVTCNEAAQRILGVNILAGVDITFAEAFLSLEHNDAFNQAILDAIYNQSVAQQRVVPFTKDGRTVVLSLTTSFLRGSEEGTEENVGVIAVFNDITELRQLQEAERLNAEALNNKHRELQDAFRAIESSNTKLSDALAKIRTVRRFALLFGAVTVIGLTAIYRYMAELSPSAIISHQSAEPAALNNPMHTVAPRPLTTYLSLTGRLLPLQTVNVSSPLAGRLSQVNVRYGDTVQAGDVLLTLDTSEVQVRLRETRSAVIRAEENLRQLLQWEQSPDMTRARRSVIRSKLAMDAQKKTLEEAERLFNKGIIPANELDAVKQQFANQQLDYQSAEDEVSSVMARGSTEQLQVARMELDNHRARLKQFENELTQSVVRAPVAGIVMKPATPGSEKHTRTITAGESFGQGEVILALGDLSGLQVMARVDEVDVTKLRPGQRVTVKGDAFPGIELIGEVRNVSPQPTDLESRTVPTFVVQAAIQSLTAAQREQVWVGMSAQMDVQTRHNPSALIVPMGAVITSGGQNWVFKHEASTGAARQMPVVTGQTLVDGVEVVHGLQAGDVVVLGRRSVDAPSFSAPSVRP